MGELLTGSGGRATLKVRVQNPAWVDYRRVDVFVNPVVYANADNATYVDPSSLNPTFTYCNTLTDTSGTCRNAPTYVSSFTPSTVSIPSLGGATGREEATLSVPLTLTQDAWVVVVIWDGRSEQYTGYGDNTLAFTNPIYIDQNGDGHFTAPCANYNAAVGCAALRPLAERPGDVVTEERTLSEHEEELQRVSEVFRKVFGAMNSEVR